jgi:hypothetical protein
VSSATSLVAEAPPEQHTDEQGADHPALDEQWDAEQGGDRLAERVRPRRLLAGRVVDDHGVAAGGDAGGEALTQAAPSAQSRCAVIPPAARETLATRSVVVQQDGSGVDLEHLDDALQELAQHLVEIERGERGLRHALHRLQAPGDPLGLRARGPARPGAARAGPRRACARAGPAPGSGWRRRRRSPPPRSCTGTERRRHPGVTSRSSTS